MFSIDLIIAEYEKDKPLRTGQGREIIVNNNDADMYSLKADYFISELLTDVNNQNGSQINCAVSLGFCFAACATYINQKLNILTRRVGYKDLPVWEAFPFSMLNINAEDIYYDFGYTEDDPPGRDDIRLTEKAEFLKWLFSPDGNTDILDGILKNICESMVKKLNNALPSSKVSRHIVLNISFPPISCDFELPDWEYIFSNIGNDNYTINIKNQFKEYVLNDMRKYVVWKHEWDFGECYVVFVFENGKLDPIDCFACIRRDSENNIELLALKLLPETTHQVLKKNVILQTSSNMALQNKRSASFVKPKNEVPAGFLSYLGSHGVGFYDAFFSVIKAADNAAKDLMTSQISTILGNSSGQMSFVCSKILNEYNLSKIALSDMVGIGICLEHKKFFKQTIIQNRGQSCIGSKKNLFENYDVSGLPANYASTIWKLSTRKTFDNNYHDLSYDFLKRVGIKEHIERIVDALNNSDTELIAEEILAAYGFSGFPSSLFVAKLYCYLADDADFIPLQNNQIVNDFSKNLSPCFGKNQKPNGNNNVKLAESNNAKSAESNNAKQKPQKVNRKTNFLVVYDKADFNKAHSIDYLWDKYGSLGMNIKIQREDLRNQNRYFNMLNFDKETRCLTGYWNEENRKERQIFVGKYTRFYIYRKRNNI